MSDTRPYPKILRTTVDADRDLRAYAAEYEIKPFEALVVAIDRLRDPVESEGLQASLDKATATIESLTTAHDALLAETERIRARELVRVGELAAERKTATDLRSDLESAREATRRADAEIDRLEADLTTAGEDLEAERRSDEAAHDAFRAEIERLTRTLEEATESARVANVGRARAEQSAAAAEASTAAAVRLVERREKELAGERLKTEAAQAREQQARTEAADLQARRSGAAPCACALPADLAARVKARIAARPGRDFAFVVKNGCDRLEGSDRYVDKKKAERTELDQ